MNKYEYLNERLSQTFSEASRHEFHGLLYSGVRDIESALMQLKALKNKNISRDINDISNALAKITSASQMLKRFDDKGLL